MERGHHRTGLPSRRLVLVRLLRRLAMTDGFHFLQP
jgi:hypothetical protein